MSWRKWFSWLLEPRASEEDFFEPIDPEDVVCMPIEDRLDLHAFQPREVGPLLEDYLEAACEKGFQEVVVVHGKGTGVLARRVQAILARHPLVVSFRQAEASQGGWGATVAILRCSPR